MKRELIIDGHKISDDSECYVVAEIGHNHQGDIEKCKRLIKAAQECGAHAVKLQKRDNKTLYTKKLYNSPYDNPNSFGKTYGEHREALEFNEPQYLEIKEFCKQIGITFFATAFDFPSVDFLADLDMPAFKVASWDLTNIPLIEYIARLDKPMIISTGGATMEDIVRAYNAVGHGKIAFLHCIASYPNRAEDMNLEMIRTLRDYFPTTVIGHSDHYNGIVMAEAAYILGARIIEKHFTLDHTWKGTDHALSLEPQGLQKLCRDLERLKPAMGTGTKKILDSERKAIWKQGNAIHLAKSFIAAGKKITKDDLALKAPADGLPPYEIDKVVGKIAIHDLSTADELGWEDFEDDI